ncbi:septum site-determining protein MinC [Peptostreptococcus russellii]|uniref:septum site-determining protein MinC n=1 Tax=Peptostreptococcus russellii TaxID=215200 RepID=UPI00162434F8|nr:septum site-determining protein MinC [Peptostreptococcus russellii]MBC2577147.1 septum site-determining protein MinC [Peptostreptococcus russellii]
MSFRERDAVEFKGTGRGLILYINKECSMENIFDSISSKIKSSPNFFAGAILTDIDSNYISPYQKKLIIEYLSENYNIDYVGVDEFHFNQMMKKKEYKGATAIFKAVRTLYVMDVEENEEVDYNGSLVFMTTVPSNSLIKASCDIVILGSVEIDATVIAGGNITVMGEIRGKAYAGAYGNDSACIVARQINAQKIAVFNRESEIVMCKRRTSMSNPEIAYIDESGKIAVSQKKEILYKYSPTSIKDTSYGAFDVKEQGVMMEKNQSFNDLAYEIKYSSETDRIISKEEFEQKESKVSDGESRLKDDKKIGNISALFSNDLSSDIENKRKIDEVKEVALNTDLDKDKDKAIDINQDKLRKRKVSKKRRREVDGKKTENKIKDLKLSDKKTVDNSLDLEKNKKVRKNASKIRVVKGDDSVKTSGESKKKRLVDRLKDLLIEEEVDNEEDRL